MATIDFTWTIEGVPTDVDSIKLSDPTGTYGVRRTDTDATVVADGTDMTHSSTGVYTYDLGDITVEHEYYLEVIEDDTNPELVDYVHGFVQPPGSGDPDPTPGTESTLSINRTDARRAVARYKGLNPDSSKWGTKNTDDINAAVESGERMFYRCTMMPGEQSIHQWSFLQPVGEFELQAAYSTGTVDITTGTVTLTGGTWPSWAADGNLVVNGVSYEVASRTSDSVIVLTNTSVTGVDDDTYRLEQWQYDLPADFSAFLEPVLHYKSDDNVWHDVDKVGVGQIFRRRQQNGFVSLSNYPTVFTDVPLTSDQTTGQRFQLMVDPAPTADCTLTGQYKSNPFAMSSSAPYPMGGQPHAETLLAACIAAAELDLHGQRGDHYARFIELLRESIAIDRRLNGNKLFGYNGDRSMYRDSCDERPWERRRSASVTFPWG